MNSFSSLFHYQKPN